MSDEPVYKLRSTSLQSGVVDDLVLSESENGRTRKVLRPVIVENDVEPENTVKVALVHQKRSSTDGEWCDLQGTTLHQTKFNEPSKFPLDTAETRALHERLTDLYPIGDKGVPLGRTAYSLAYEDEIIRTDSERADLIRKLLHADHGTELWEALVEKDPALTDELIGQRVYEQRVKAIESFRANIGGSKKEEWWKDHLKKNMWMFGGGVVHVLDETRIDIHHTTDLPFEVDGGYMEVIELKRPDTLFWLWVGRGNARKMYLYRGKHPVPNQELSGALAQLDGYILQAEKRVTDSDFHTTHRVRPLKPRGVIVHGRSNDWSDREWDAFRLLNDRQHNVEVITFDMLLAQAERIAGYPPADPEPEPF